MKPARPVLAHDQTRRLLLFTEMGRLTTNRLSYWLDKLILELTGSCLHPSEPGYRQAVSAFAAGSKFGATSQEKLPDVSRA